MGGREGTQGMPTQDYSVICNPFKATFASKLGPRVTRGMGSYEETQLASSIQPLTSPVVHTTDDTKD